MNLDFMIQQRRGKMNKHNFEKVSEILKRMIKKNIVGKSLKVKKQSYGKS